MTQFCFIVILSVLSSASAHAGSYEDAQAELAAAYNNYYSVLRKKKSFSQQDAQKLAEEILAPANARVAKAMEEETARAKKEAEAAKPTEEKVAQSPQSQKERAPSSIEPAAPIVIDGSSTPKEIEFPGKTKPTSKP